MALPILYEHTLSNNPCGHLSLCVYVSGVMMMANVHYHQILDMIIEIFNSGGDAKLDVPRPSSAMEKIPESIESVQFRFVSSYRCGHAIM